MTSLELLLADLAEGPPGRLARDVASALAAADRCVRTASPIGALWVAFGPRGVNTVARAASEAEFRALYARRWRSPDRLLVTVTRPPAGLDDALAGRAAPGTVPVDLGGLGEFARAVLEATAAIPPGEVRTYREVARAVGREAAVRAVGGALARNPVPLLVPCHRVVRSDGRIGDYALGAPAKGRLLTAEGIEIVGGPARASLRTSRTSRTSTG